MPVPPVDIHAGSFLSRPALVMLHASQQQLVQFRGARLLRPVQARYMRKGLQNIHAIILVLTTAFRVLDRAAIASATTDVGEAFVVAIERGRDRAITVLIALVP